MYKEQYHRWYSPRIGKDMEMLVYGDRGYPVVLFPSTKGRYYESKDFGLIETAAWFLERGFVQIYCPDSIDAWSWYNRAIHPHHRVGNHLRYDALVREEIVQRVRWQTGTGKVAVAGASFGAFHAANFAFRHPDLVSHLFSMSGAYDTRPFMDGYYHDDLYYASPLDFLPGLSDPHLWQMKIVLGTSEWDICRPANEQMSGILHNKGVGHWLDMRGWEEHDWPLWQGMFPHYLSLI